MSSYLFIIKSELPLVIGTFLHMDPEGWVYSTSQGPQPYSRLLAIIFNAVSTWLPGALFWDYCRLAVIDYVIPVYYESKLNVTIGHRTLVDHMLVLRLLQAHFGWQLSLYAWCVLMLTTCAWLYGSSRCRLWIWLSDCWTGWFSLAAMWWMTAGSRMLRLIPTICAWHLATLIFPV